MYVSASPIASFSARPKRRFCRSAVRLSLRSASAIASADAGLSIVMPKSLTGMSVSALTMSAIVRSISECGCMLACWSCCMVGFCPFLSEGRPLMTLTMLLHVSALNWLRFAPRNQMRGAE